MLACEALFFLESTETVNPNSHSDLFSSDKAKVTEMAKLLMKKYLNYQVHRQNGNNLPSAASLGINNLNNGSNDCGDINNNNNNNNNNKRLYFLISPVYVMIFPQNIGNKDTIIIIIIIIIIINIIISI